MVNRVGINSRIGGRGIMLESTSDEAIKYIEDRLSEIRKSTLQQDLNYGNIILSPEILGQLNPVQREIILNAEFLVKEVKYFYLTYVQ